MNLSNFSEFSKEEKSPSIRNLMNDIRDLEIESFTNLSKLLKTFSDNTASHKMSPLEKSSPTNVSFKT